MFGLFKNKNKQQPPIEMKNEPSILVPRIKNSSMIQSLLKQGVPKDQLPFTQPLVGDLVISYAFDGPEMLRMASRNDLDELGLSDQEVRSLALSNMKRLVPKMEVSQTGPFLQVITGAEMEACSLLADGLWDQMKAKTQGDLIVACPHRTLVLFFSSTSEPALALINTFIDKVFKDDPVHSLTKNLLKWDAGWSIY